MTSTAPTGSVTGLRVELARTGDDIVDDVNLDLFPGQIVGLVGESASGKTTAGTALLGYARSGARIAGGRIEIAGHHVHELTPSEVRRIRGVDIGYVPQDPNSALNPALRIERQLSELLDLHGIGEPADRMQRIREILTQVGLPDSAEFLRRYPHQLSGGQVQRVALAMVFLPRPKVLVLDEPTTGLDVVTQGLVLATLRKLCLEFDVAALYVTHDLAVVATIADHIAVMYAGRLVEYGSTAEVFQDPRHPYTRALLGAIPSIRAPHTLHGLPGQPPRIGARPQGCRLSDRCTLVEAGCRSSEPEPVQIGEVHWTRCRRSFELGEWDQSDRIVADTNPCEARDPVLAVSHLTVSHGRTPVVHDVSFGLGEREVVALVGGSGAGKTTISRAVAGITAQWSGEVRFGDIVVRQAARSRTAEQRQAIQYVFQNPYQSLNPRRTVEEILLRPITLFGPERGRAARERAAALLDDVQLSPDLLRSRTGRLSGGERQRVAIARALAAQPRVLVCDEITSALDVSIQAAIIELLTSIKHERGISMLFVTHNLALVRTFADRVIVLEAGRVVEHGFAAQVLEHPTSAYAATLVAHTPSLESAFTQHSSAG